MNMTAVEQEDSLRSVALAHCNTMQLGPAISGTRQTASAALSNAEARCLPLFPPRETGGRKDKRHISEARAQRHAEAGRGEDIGAFEHQAGTQ